jgi:photosynthetic reaction center cytochrome c subunit
MNQKFFLGIGLAIAGLAGLLLVRYGFERPPIDTIQRGYRGLAMEQNYNPRLLAPIKAANVAPAPLQAVPPVGGPAGSVYKNVQVLKDVPVAEFTRLMVAVTDWVAPQQGCTYCHVSGDDLASDNIYTKVVSRRMFQMTLDINKNWKNHVAASGPTGANGVTCYTCHRGQPVPANIWFTDPGARAGKAGLGDRAGQNAPSPVVQYASLPNDPSSLYLRGDGNDLNIRVIPTTALPSHTGQTIKQAEFTYGLMMQISKNVGVNCTFCHNSRSFFAWDSSTPQRTTAFYGIALVRALNNSYLTPLTNTFPAARLGPTGDAPKVNCATCHAGVYKPLFGANMIKDYPVLAK